MYEEMITKQELIDAQVDAKDLEKIINDAPEIQVQTRLGRYVWTLSTIEQRSFAKINEWQNAINTIVINDGVPALAVSNANGKTQQEINDFGGAEWWNKTGGYKLGATVKLENGDVVKSNTANNIINPNVDMTGWEFIGKKTVPSILDLKNVMPFDGMTVKVLTHSGFSSGGAKLYTFSESSSKLDNNGSYIKSNITDVGCWISEYTGIIDVRWFGGIGDGITDNRLAAQRANIYIREMGGGELQLNNGVYLFNSYLTENFYSWGACINLDSNMNLKINEDATLKVGAFKDTWDLLIVSLVGATPTTWDATKNTDATEIKNNRIYGGGTVDFTDSGGMSVAQRSRVFAAVCRNSDFILEDLKFKGGDMSGIVTNLKCKNYGNNNTVRGCTFLDMMKGKTYNTDHSTIYLLATNSKIYGNKFHNTTAQGKLAASPFELHNSNSYAYNNEIIGYTNGGIVAFEDSEHFDLTRPIGNVFIYGNTINTVRAFCYFDLSNKFDRVLPVKFYDNICVSQPYITEAERQQTWFSSQEARHWFLFYNAVAQTGSTKADIVEIYNNVLIEDTTNYDYVNTTKNSSLVQVAGDQYPCRNLVIRNNKIKVKRLFDSSNITSLKRIFNGWKIKDNDIDVSLFDPAKIQLNFECLYVDKCNFDIKFETWASYAPSVSFMSINQAYMDSGSANTIVIHQQNTQDIQLPFLCNDGFTAQARANKVKYPCTAVILVEPFNQTANTVKISTVVTSSFPYQMTNRVGLKKAEIYTLADSNIIPNSLFKDGVAGLSGFATYIGTTFPTGNTSTSARLIIEN